MKDNDQKMQGCNDRDYLARLMDEMNEGQDRALLKTVDDTRRRYVRKPCLVAVDYSIGEFAYRGFIKNISISGVFIETSETFPNGLNLTMSFSLPRYEKPVKTSGKIVRNGSEGIGITLEQKGNQNLSSAIESLGE